MLDKTNPWRVWILSLLIAIMPLSFALPVKAKAVPALILFLTGLWVLATRADVRRAYRRAAPVLAPAAIAFVFWAVNVGAHGVNWREFDVTSHILAFLVIAATFALPLRTAALRVGFSGSAGVLGLICVEQHYIEHIDRAYGINNGEWGAIEFGMFMLVLSLIAIVQALRGELRSRERAMHAVFAVMGFYGALLTQSRGPLLAFVPVFAALMLIQGRRTGRWRQSVLALVIGVAAAGLAATTLHGEMVERLAAVKDEVATYSEQDATGAVRERLEMWRTARMAVIAHPVTGVGMNQFGPFARARIADGEVNPSVVRYDHPHSEYLEWAATGGIPGLLVLVLLFGGSLIYFGRHALNRDNAIAMPACAGFSTTAMYALCALTDNVFYRAMPHSLYFFLTLGLAVYVGRALDRHRTGAGAS
ncbi:MAG: O-antigen ligase family protein [Luteibacter sp.]|uniref:O-antigen ligase family protein n=1 Tax=unclassified Luteibacter TaxID=2620188 RepID=UPI002807FD64|nr:MULTISPECIES: O-antigen ligase family protein [unclassified Luteibacter]MDQ7994277.1 O-antigen ligase family protein [Luteibacter sp.]MDQ8048577.1 O-antigen ligase family protein [Luteibacter sp.]MDR6642229.1 O-antigen ligase [Luteibacter sp. 1214]